MDRLDDVVVRQDGVGRAELGRQPEARGAFTSIATMRSAPATFAAITAASPTVPQPNTATELPGCERASLKIAPAPVITPQPIGARSSSGRSASTRNALRALATAWVAKDDWPTKFPRWGPDRR